MPPSLYRSSIPYAKAALVALLQARPSLDGLVTYGVPRTTGGGREWIVVGNVRGDQEAVTLRGGRPHHRDERYTILVVVSVVGSNLDEPQTITERAYDLVAEIEDEVRTTPTLGIDGDYTRGRFEAHVTRTDLDEHPGDGDQRSSHVTVHVECVARI